MDFSEAIQSLALKESKNLKIHKDIESVNYTLPFFQIENGKVKIGGYKTHDNAPRMLYFSRYIKDKVLPNIPNNHNLNGFYNIELHDSNSYVQNNYENCLVWSKTKNDNASVLIPDIFNLCNYGNRLNDFKDHNIWEKKIDKMAFWGSTTGSVEPSRNQRINDCLWFKSMDPHHTFSDVFITRIAQMNPSTVIKQIPNFLDICRYPVTYNEQYNYKILIDIPGNTCCWDRTPLILNSNSLLFKMPCDDMCYYYPLLHEGLCYVQVDRSNIFNKFNYYLKNPNEAKNIIRNADIFTNNVLNEDTANLYLTTFFKSISDRHSN